MHTPPPGSASDADRYAEFGNGALVRIVRSVLPERGSLLDIGCATGGLLAQFGDASRRVGVEGNAEAAEHARRVCDLVVVADLLGEDLPIEERFDVVVCGDVLEHLPDPVEGLRRAVAFVRPGGRIVVSVPNVGFVSARWRFLSGRFHYDETGIFDDTHLRFFNPDVLSDVARRAGITVDRIVPVVPALRNVVPQLERTPRRVRRSVERAWQRLGTRWPGLLGYQLVAVGTPGT